MAKTQKDTKENDVSEELDTDTSSDATKPSDTKTEQKTAKESVQVLRVIAKREGFRRAGMTFGSESTRLVVSDLTAEQIAQLKAEPMLVVTEATEAV